MQKQVSVIWMFKQGPLYTETPNGTIRRRFSLSELERLIRIPILKPPDSASSLDILVAQAYFAANSILFMFFGDKWVENNSMLDVSNEFLRGNPKNQFELGINISRRLLLAELLFNLQDVPGIDSTIDQIRDGMIESGFAELETGKLLARYGVKFRFIEATGEKGADYDLEIDHHNGRVCCAEVKSKEENKTPLNQKTILRSLKNARDQMPNDRPGIIFMKVPYNWYILSDFDNIFKLAIEGLSSKRLTSVIVFSNITQVVMDRRLTMMASKEFFNIDHRFEKSVDWRLISNRPEPPYDPPNWMRLENLCRAIGPRFI